MDSSVLSALFKNHFKVPPDSVTALKAHASHRKIYRLKAGDLTAIGVENSDAHENRSFIYLSRHFKSKGLNVPEIYAEDKSGVFYLQEDLGDVTLYDHLFSLRKDSDPFPRSVEALYNRAVSALIQFQVNGSEGLDYGRTSNFESFSPKNMLSDMEYFRTQYLEQTAAVYDRAGLERDFHTFAEYLSGAPAEHFMYRDFQSRNIMLKDGELFFIDYQSGCRGALQYDIASLLFQGQARIPYDVRDRILTFYIGELLKRVQLNRHEFLRYFYAFVILRMMQVLGTYGLRGLKEGKQYFIDSIELALKNLRYVYRTQGLPVPMPEFERFIKGINVAEEKLTVSIYSFSYKLALEFPFNQHGGGFVFDGRCLPNPGREEQYKKKSGLDSEVIAYLENQENVHDYFNSIATVVDQAVEAYQARKFLNLSVAFGCTGGQHRSVYLAERLGRHLKNKYDVNILVHHLTKDHWVC